MADHSRSVWQELFNNIFGIGGLCRSYKSLFSNRHPKKNHQSPHESKSQPKDKLKSIDLTFTALNDNNPVEIAMNNVHSCSYSSMPSSSSRTPSPTSISRNISLSKNASRSRLSRSMSQQNTSEVTKPPAGVSVSRSLSRKGSKIQSSLLSRSASRRGSTPIMYSNSSGLMKPPASEKKLECTLEELCFGCIKKIMVTRDVVTDNGHIVEEEEMLTIKVKPGWRKGTKITFEGIGNETPGTYPGDIIFVIEEKKHPMYTRREGDDLELAVKVPLVKALTGCSVPVPLLGGGKMSLAIDDIVQPGYEKTIAGQGMPKPIGEGDRGKLIIKFLVEFPLELTDQQREDVFRILQGSC